MKKLFSLLLTLVMCLSMAACANDQTKTTVPTETLAPSEDDDKIYLTLDNYKKYYKVSASIGDKGFYNGWGPTQSLEDGLVAFRSVSGNIQASGLSENYNYHDITITVKFTYTYGEGKFFEKTYTSEVSDITGYINDSTYLYQGESIEVDEGYGRAERDKVEIIGITGYLEPV